MNGRGRDPWGGGFEIEAGNADPSVVQNGQEFDRAALSRPSEETRQSWLLHPIERNAKKKSINLLGCIHIPRKLVIWTVLSVLLIVGLIILIVRTVPHHHPPPPPTPDNYTLALHNALMFFNAQKSGRLPVDNNVSWRGNSVMNDGVVGGYYDAGDATKLSFPASFAMTMLSWSVIEYRNKYEAAGELGHIMKTIKWGTDYLLHTFDHNASSINRITAQVGINSEGEGYSSPNACWIRPEDIGNARQPYDCYDCSEVAGEMAAALAAASIVFRDDMTYSQTLVHGAGILLKFSLALNSSSIYGGKADHRTLFHDPTGFWDEILWGGAWLYYATGNSSYLDLVTSRDLANKADAIRGGLDNDVLSRGNKVAGAQLLLSRLRMFLSPGYPYEDLLSIFHTQTDNIMCSYLPKFASFNRTKGGLIQLNHGGPQPLQYAVNAAFLAKLYSDYMKATGLPGSTCGSHFFSSNDLVEFAKSQIDYILGKNPRKMSYVVGFGDKYPKQVHHRGASIPKDGVKYSCKGGLKWRDSPKANPNTIVGAMVAGPDKDDRFQDKRSNYNYTEPTLAGNAGLVAALVALSGDDRTGIDHSAMFYSVRSLQPPAPRKP